MWLGATSFGRTSRWRWAGTQREVQAYSNWRPGEPEARDDAWQVCAYMRTDGGDMRWDDWRCDKAALNYVCEIQLEV